MDDAGVRSSWSMSVTNGRGFTLALFVRDRYDLPVGVDVPALSPPVSAERARSLDAFAAAAWDEWWVRLVAAPPGRVVRPDHDEQLAALFDEVEHEALSWEEDHIRLADPQYLSPAPGQWLDDHVSPGDRVDCVLQVVGVRGSWFLEVDPGHLLISLDLYRDHARLDATLIAALEQAGVTDVGS